MIPILCMLSSVCKLLMCHVYKNRTMKWWLDWLFSFVMIAMFYHVSKLSRLSLFDLSVNSLYGNSRSFHTLYNHRFPFVEHVFIENIIDDAGLLSSTWPLPKSLVYLDLSRNKLTGNSVYVCFSTGPNVYLIMSHRFNFIFCCVTSHRGVLQDFRLQVG